jgi:AcrR family transcriptional regulator
MSAGELSVGGPSFARDGARYARLRSGAHGLAREQVRADQTGRLRAAMVELVVERGYRAVSVADVLARAGVSRRTFYEHYPGKEACFVEAYDAIVGDWIAGAAAARRGAASWREGLRGSTLAVVERVLADPIAAHAVFIEALSAGAEALERRAEAVAGFERLARASFEMAPGGAQVRPAMFRVFVGGVRGILANRLRDRRTDELLTLADPLIEWMLCYRSRAATEILDKAGEVAASGERVDASEPSSAEPSDHFPELAGMWLWLEDSARPVVWSTPRERILSAVTEIVGGKGYEALSVAEIARVARTTHQTFNKLFASREEAFLTAHDEGVRQAVAAADDGSRGASSWPAAVRESLLAETRFLASHPDIARLALLYTGREASRRGEAPLRALNDCLEQGRARGGRSAIAVEAITSGILALMRDVAVHPGPERLPAVVPDAVFAALAPFIGAEPAAVEAARSVGG